MYERMKKKMRNRWLIILIIYAIVGGFIAVGTSGNALQFLIGETDITNATISKIEDTEYVKLVVDKDNLIDLFMYEGKEYSSGAKSIDYYYGMVFVGDDVDSKIMIVKFAKSDYRTIQDIFDEQDAEYDGDTVYNPTQIVIKGRKKAVPSDIKKEYLSYMIDADFSTSESSEMLMGEYVYESKGNIFSLFVIGGYFVFLILIIVKFILTLSDRYVEKFKAKTEQNKPGLLAAAEQDYENPLFIINKDVRIGHRFTFDIHAKKIVIMDNNEIVWVYPTITTHRTNGIKTGTTYSVNVFDINKTNIIISSPSEEKNKEYCATFANLSGRVVVGYTNELSKMFKKNFPEFLNLKYNLATNNQGYNYNQGFDSNTQNNYNQNFDSNTQNNYNQGFDSNAQDNYNQNGYDPYK